MERTFSPMIRQFSAIDGLQKAYTLVYSMDTGNEDGCCLTLCRTGSRQPVQKPVHCSCTRVLLPDPALSV